MAVTGASIVTLRSVQLKGRALGVEDATAADVGRAERYCEAFYGDLYETDRVERSLFDRLVPSGYVACTLAVEQRVRPDARTRRRSPDRHRRSMTSPALEDLRLCFEGAVPAVIATAVGRRHPQRHLPVEGPPRRPRARGPVEPVLLQDGEEPGREPPRQRAAHRAASYSQFRLHLAYERTERRGPVFERLRGDIEALAALVGMQGVFKLQAADIYRVIDIEAVPTALNRPADGIAALTTANDGPDAQAIAELGARLSRCADLDTLVSATVDGLAELFDYQHSLVLLLDEDGRRLYTIASHGYAAEGVGSEVVVGEGLVGLTAERCTAMRVGSLRQMDKYSRSVRQSYEDSGDASPGTGHRGADHGRRGEPPGRAGDGLRPARRCGHRREPSDRCLRPRRRSRAQRGRHAARQRGGERAAPRTAAKRTRRTPAETPGPTPDVPAAHLRFFSVGRQHVPRRRVPHQGRGRPHPVVDRRSARARRPRRLHATARCASTPPSTCPPYRDNFENRLILLKRRLDERDAPIRIEKTGRGRFRLQIGAPLRCECADAED